MIQMVVGNPKVLKLESDHTVGSEKHRMVHFCESFSLKNGSVEKKQGHVRIAVEKKQGHVRIAVGPYGFENCKRFLQFL